MTYRKDDTNLGDILKDHFGVTNFQNQRALKKDTLEQDRIEQMNVNLGNAPAAKTAAQPQPQQAVYAQTVPLSMKSETSQDNKCQNCGGTLAYDPSTGGMVCNFCGSRTQINMIPAAPGLGYSLQDLGNLAGRGIQMTAKQIVCGTCGGKFIADSSAISGLCPYCGSNSITLSSDSNGVLEPTGVVPFAVSKDQAQEIFKQWIRKRRLAPMDIVKNAQITDLVGVYVPYWVFNCDTYTPYNGKFGRTYGSGDDSYTKYHKSSGVCQLQIKDLTLVATGRLQKDAFWKSVSSFNLNFMKRYDPNLLAGFWSESYTVDGITAWQTAMTRIYDMIRARIKSMEAADVISKLDMQPGATNIRAKYVLAPIWITSFDYHGTIYRVLINGQTGNIVGTWPKSFKRFFMIFGIIVGAIFGTQFLMALLAMLLSWLSSR